MKNPSLPYSSEEQVQRTIIEGLQYTRGVTVLQTSHRTSSTRTCTKCRTKNSIKQTCSACGSYLPVGHGYGATKGVPDLLVTRDSWPTGFWVGLEVKGPKTPLSPEQAALLEKGRIYVVRSWEDASAALTRAQRAMEALNG
jgi:hypothetical protein